VSAAAEAPKSYDKSEQSLRAGFPQLTIKRFGKSLVAYQPGTSTVINKRLADLPRSHALFSDDGLEAGDVLLMETTFAGSDRYLVVFSEGPSADPEFYFYRPGAPAEKVFGSVAGAAVAIPGNGFLYTANRSNNYFTRRAKFIYEPTGLREVHQPYYLVGLKTHTLKPVTLYDSPKGGSEVAQLPAGSDIEVVLANDEEDADSRACFLVKTPFGLLGWVWVPSSQVESTVIEGISWWGD
jgi:hypothetical protein